jgi:hypothetical protein
MARPERENYCTPRGTLVGFVNLDRPDTQFSKGDDDLGEYKARMVIEDETAMGEFQAKLDDILERWVKEVKAGGADGKKHKNVKVTDDGRPYFAEIDPDSEEETGRTLFRFKLKRRVVKKAGGHFDQRPAIYDAKRQKIEVDISPGAGTEARISGQVFKWYTAKLGAGISLWLQGVQILKLVEGGGAPKTAEGFGFEAEEDGFEADPLQVEDTDGGDDTGDGQSDF